MGFAISDINEADIKKDFSKEGLKIIIVTELFGIDKKYIKTILTRCKDEGLNIDTVNLNPIKDFTAEYKKYDLLLSPNNSYKNSIKIIEALRAGLPILLTDITGNGKSEYINGNGYLIKDDDTELLYKAIKYFYENKPQLKTMGANSRKLFVKKFIIKNTIDIKQEGTQRHV